MKIKAEIQNSTDGAATYTGQNRARRLIKSGRARLVRQCPETGAILIIALANYVVDLEQKRIEQEARLKQFARERQGQNYDSIDRLMTFDEMPNVPLVGDIQKTMEKPSGSLRGWSYAAGAGRRQRKMDPPEKVAEDRLRYFPLASAQVFSSSTNPSGE